MNKSDFIFISIVAIISVILLILVKSSSNGNIANVYYENNIIKKIDLNKDSSYEVEGYNGIIKIEVKSKQIRVVSETSLYHLCSKQGFVSSSLEPIICLPNKVVIKIESDSNIDTVVR